MTSYTRSDHRAALLLSSAISLATITEAHGQATYEDTGPGNVVYNAASVSGVPEVIFLSSPDGNVSAAVGTVTSTSSAGDTGNVISASAAGANTVTVDITTLTASGAGDVTGVFTNTAAGLADITVGSLDLAGQRGIAANALGDVTITAGAVRVVGNGGQANIDAIAAGREVGPDGERIRVGGNLQVDAASV